MPNTFALNLAKPIKSVSILDGYSSNAQSSVINNMDSAVNTEQAELIEDLKAQKRLFSDTCRTVQCVAAKLNQVYDEIFTEHKEEIAKLSVEIARKILMQKIQDGDYEIESIVKETLKNAPAHQDLIVYLNPEDLAVCQKAQADNDSESLVGIKFVADPNIGRAECVLESQKGIIRSLIDEHLDQIEKALKKTG